jgi:hypothetical protein
MTRPRISDEAHEHIREIYRAHTDRAPPDFETALFVVLELASKKAEEDLDWHPGKYAKKALQGVLDDAARHHSPSSTEYGSEDHSGDRAEFRAILDDEGRVEVPLAEQRALGIGSDALLEVTVRPFDREDSPE